jgi:hypothetical protein
MSKLVSNFIKILNSREEERKEKMKIRKEKRKEIKEKRKQKEIPVTIAQEPKEIQENGEPMVSSEPVETNEVNVEEKIEQQIQETPQIEEIEDSEEEEEEDCKLLEFKQFL